MAAALLAVMASPLAASVCGATEDATCIVGWTFGSALLSLALALGLVAWVLRLGWEWWALVAGVLLGTPWWVDAVPTPAVVVVGALTPPLAAPAPLTGRRRPAWRPWAVAAVFVGSLALGTWAVVG